MLDLFTPAAPIAFLAACYLVGDSLREMFGKAMKKIIAVDFDGTVVTHEYPEIGKEVRNCVKVLKALNDCGVHLILWTMRSGEYLAQAVQWFEERGIELWGINDNPEQETWTDSRKVYAPIYIDDAALGCPLTNPFNGKRPFVNWFAIELILKEKGYLDERKIAVKDWIDDMEKVAEECRETERLTADDLNLVVNV